MSAGRQAPAAARVTPFQRRVYAALRRVPRGRVTTYALLGRMIGCACAQAIGQAVRRNPFAPRVPCHRVIASDLTIGGFGGDVRGARIAAKRRLLAAERVFFRHGRLADPARVYPARDAARRASE